MSSKMAKTAKSGSKMAAPAAKAERAPATADKGAYKPSPRSRVKRLPKRGHYDRETVHGILDAGLVAHIAYVIDGQPYVTPTAYWREGETIYWHGSAASRMLRAQAAGIPVCVTVTHLDGLVVARSGFHHSINYRSVMAFGQAHLVEDPAAKEKALEVFLERLYPGRWQQLRPATRQELKGTTVVAMAIQEASAKVRVGPPVDDEPDYALPCWAGVVPIVTTVGALQPDPLMVPGRPATEDLGDFQPGRAFDAILSGRD